MRLYTCRKCGAQYQHDRGYAHATGGCPLIMPSLVIQPAKSLK